MRADEKHASNAISQRTVRAEHLTRALLVAILLDVKIDLVLKRN
jgi:hypothetical protein